MQKNIKNDMYVETYQTRYGGRKILNTLCMQKHIK